MPALDRSTTLSPMATAAGSELSSVIVATVRNEFAHRFGLAPRHLETAVEDETVCCLLCGVLTPLEEHAVAAGRTDLVVALRRVAEPAIAEALRRVVSEATGRSLLTVAFGFDPIADVASLRCEVGDAVVAGGGSKSAAGSMPNNVVPIASVRRRGPVGV